MTVFYQPVTLSFLVGQVFSSLMTCVIVSAALKFRSVESALGFYGVYHQEPMNQIVRSLLPFWFSYRMSSNNISNVHVRFWTHILSI